MAIPIRVKKEIPPTHPGAVLREDIMPDYGLTTASLADALGVSRQTINEILQKIEAQEQSISRLRELLKNSGIDPSQALDVLQELVNEQNAEFQKRFNHRYYDPSFAQNDR
jgi:transcriptional regulator with XRE-family HTH domain